MSRRGSIQASRRHEASTHARGLLTVGSSSCIPLTTYSVMNLGSIVLVLGFGQPLGYESPFNQGRPLHECFLVGGRKCSGHCLYKLRRLCRRRAYAVRPHRGGGGCQDWRATTMLSWRLLSHSTFLELGIAFPVEVYSSLCSSTNLEDGSFRLSPTGCRALFISLFVYGFGERSD
jgi:hypothetical protein